MAWTQFTYDATGTFVESPIVLSKSSDSGRTWSGLRRVSPSLTNFHGGITPFGSGSNPQVTRDGTLHIAYETSVCATAACDHAEGTDAVADACDHSSAAPAAPAVTPRRMSRSRNRRRALARR